LGLKKKIKPVKFYFSQHKSLYHAIKNIFGFYPGNIFLYKLAFRHKSVAQKQHGTLISNERLEYLGDAILGAVVAEFLFKLYPYEDEGFLTDMRSKLVSRVQLNKLSAKLGLDRLVQINASKSQYSKSYKGDAFEAFIGALYLDKGFDFTSQIVVKHIIKVHLDIEEIRKTEGNFKSRVIEWGQKNKKSVVFKVIDEKGQGQKKQYVVEIFIDNKSYGTEQDYSIKGAEKILSEKTWSKLKNNS